MTGSEARKPVLVFFQYDHTHLSGYCSYLIDHTKAHVDCLRHYFDVKVVNHDCDYGEICDRFMPDICMFETGYQLVQSRRPRIRNLNSHGSVPRVALFNSDSWSNTRSLLFNDLDRIGFEAVFAICATSRAYMEDISDILYIWPNFVDSSIYSDYGLEKVSTVMITGQKLTLYPWRRSIFPVLSELYTTLNVPSFWYLSGLAERSLTGEPYARAINSCLFAPACGGMAREAVRKHFEIPGSGTCLIAEESETLHAAGFAHMRNCVFVNKDNVVDILDHLISDRDLLHAITKAGHDLVHDRHTSRHRPQILQWYKHRLVGCSDRIVQVNPFGSLEIVPARATVKPLVTSDSLDRELLRRAADLMSAGKISDARTLFQQCVTYSPDLPEANLGLALCDLYQGAAGEAADRLRKMIDKTLVEYGATEPDPVEWLFLVVAVLSRGNSPTAWSLAQRFPSLLDPETLELLFGAAPGDGRDLAPANAGVRARRTIHGFLHREVRDLARSLPRILTVNGQTELAASLVARREETAPNRLASPGSGRSLMAPMVGKQMLTGSRIRTMATESKYALKVIVSGAKLRFSQSALGSHLWTFWRRYQSRAELAKLRSELVAKGADDQK